MVIKFINPWKKVTCYFCFHKFHINEAHVRDQSPGAHNEDDEKIQKLLDLPTPPSTAPCHKISNFYLFAKFLLSSDFLKENHVPVCPNCHMALPHETISNTATSCEINSKSIAIIGGRLSGKSNYFGILIKELKKIVNDIDFSIIAQETFCAKNFIGISSNEIYESRYNLPLKKNIAVKPTDSVLQDKQTRMPLIYRIRFNHKNFWKPKVIDLIFYDAAGEDIEQKDRMYKYANYILDASGIIFLIDPMEYKEVIDKLPESKLPESFRNKKAAKQNIEPGKIVEDIIYLFETNNKNYDVFSSKIKTPVAFVLSKCDLFNDSISSGTQIRNDPDHYKGFNKKDIDLVSDEVRDIISEFESAALIKNADDRFEEKKFFAVSALGALPDKNYELNSIQPHRVTDPILWLFWKNGLIPLMKEFELSTKANIISEIISTIVILLYLFIFNSDNSLFQSKFMYSPFITFVAGLLIGGYSFVINRSRRFHDNKLLPSCLISVALLFFFAPNDYPTINLVLTGWCLTIVVQQILVQTDFESKLTYYSLKEKEIMFVFIFLPLVISVIVLNFF